MPVKPAVNPDVFGVTFSLKQCRSFDIDPSATLNWLIDEAGFRRFRLMSYWNEHEREPNKFDFSALDKQLDMIEQAGGVVSLCLGARQPRWPENHWPDWVWQLPKEQRSAALLKYIESVVNRYKDRKCIISYQLENEALLQRWGERSEVDRARLLEEYLLVQRLDPAKPIIMTTSTSWGIPVRRPIPDVVGFSYYRVVYRDGKYHQSLFYPWIHKLRKILIRLLHNRPVFIHELQLEPWGPKAIWEMPIEEQAKSMDPNQIAENIRLAKRIAAAPIDVWGGEWWYWRLQQGDTSIWQAVQQAIFANIS